MTIDEASADADDGRRYESGCEIVAVRTYIHGQFPNLLFVEVETRDGLVGVGETFYGVQAVAAHVHDVLAPQLLGMQSTRIRHINDLVRGYVGYAGSGAETRARSAIDIALWDLLGQRAGLPLRDLIGGATSDDIRAYNTCAGSNYVRRNGQAVASWGLDVAPDRYEDLALFLSDAGRLAQQLLEMGIDAMKIWPFDSFAESNGGNFITGCQLDEALGPVRSIREAVGAEIDIMIELHGLWNVPSARRIVAALEPYDVLWVEDPVRSDVVHGLADVADSTDIMIAAGETIAGADAFHHHLTSGAIDVVTLDVGWTGGLTKALEIVSLAAQHGRAVAPHDCTGPIALTTATHLSTSASNAMIQEMVRASLFGWYGDLVTSLPTLADGRIAPPSGFGLGTTLSDRVRRGSDVQSRSTNIR